MYTQKPDIASNIGVLDKHRFSKTDIYAGAINIRFCQSAGLLGQDICIPVGKVLLSFLETQLIV